MRVPFLLFSLERNIIDSNISFLELPDPIRISFITKIDRLPEGNVIICNGTELSELLQKNTFNGEVTIFASGDYGDAPLYKPGNVNIISVSLEQMELYEELERLRAAEIDWIKTCTYTVLNASDESIITKFGKMFGAPIIFVDKHCHIIDFYGAESSMDDIILNIIKNGCLKNSFIPKFFDLCYNNPSRLETSFRTESSNICYVSTIISENDCIAYLLSFSRGLKPDNDLMLKLLTLAKTLKDYFYINSRFSIHTNGAPLATLLDFCLASVHPDLDRMNALIRQLSVPVKRFYSIFLIEFNNSERKTLPYNMLLSQLQHILPGQNITVYNNDIVILYTNSSAKYADQLDIDYNEIEAFLRMWDARMAITQQLSNWFRINLSYTGSKSTLEFARNYYPENKETRIYYWIDFLPEAIIKGSVDRLQQIGGNNELIYLMDPDVILLKMHDLKEDDNLTVVLEQYLIYGYQASAAARALNMHRNTVIRKIEEIRQITSARFENPKNHLAFLHSISEMNYYCKCMKKDPLKYSVPAPFGLSSSDEVINR